MGPRPRRAVAVAGALLSAAAPLLSGAAGAGCAATPPGGPRAPEGRRTPVAAAALMVDRPYRVIPEPDRFIQGALIGLTEGIIRAGYDFQGVVREDVPDAAAVAEHLAELNARVPGTAAIHLEFVEAPTLVGFGTAYTSVTCTIHDPTGDVLFAFEPEPPTRRAVVDLFLPRLRPDADGRAWAERLWRERLSLWFRPRG